MKVGIIGAGHIAEVHGPVILSQENATLVGIADRDLMRAEATAERLGAANYYADAEEMIKIEKPDVVHVLVPPHLHADLSVMAMDLGCHVLVEKPLALSIDDAKRMIDGAKTNNVKLCVDHNLVYSKLIQKLLRHVRNGEIGDPVSAEVNFQFNVKRYPVILEKGAQYCHWSYRMNGGPLQDQIPHPASLIFELLTDIEEVKTIEKNRGRVPKPWNDEIRILVNSSTMMGAINISFSEKPDTISLQVKGTEGTIIADLYNETLTLQKNSALPRAAARGLAALIIGLQNLKAFFLNIFNFATGRVDKSNGIDPIVRKFYEAIRNDTEPPISYRKSYQVVELMNRVWPNPFQEFSQVVSSSGKIQGDADVLVTGGSGFIGYHLIGKLLKAGHTVRTLVRLNSLHGGRLKGMDVEIIQGDLTNLETLEKAVKGVKKIFHAGSPMTNNWKDYEEGAVTATENLIRIALEKKVERFVQFSSLAVYELLDIYGNSIEENSPYQKKPKLMGPYAWAKVKTEKMVLEAHKEKGLPATIVRPGIVIGPMGNLFPPHLGFKSGDRLFMMIGKGDTVLPFTYIENTVDAIYQASIEEKAIGNAYNIIDDGKITVKEYLDRYVANTGIPAKIISLPTFVPYSAVFIYEIVSSLGILKKGVTSRKQLKWKQAKVLFENKKAKEDLKWKQKVPLDEGLTKSFQWYGEKFA